MTNRIYENKSPVKMWVYCRACGRWEYCQIENGQALCNKTGKEIGGIDYDL